MTSIESKLEHWDNGMPKLELFPLPNTVVNVTTQREYDKLMQAYEAGGWSWRSGNLPTNYNNKICETTNIWVSDHFKQTDTPELPKYVSVIKLVEFCEIEGIKYSGIKEIGEWFDENKPYRASSGKVEIKTSEQSLN